jgi:hypothetical protein
VLMFPRVASFFTAGSQHVVRVGETSYALHAVPHSDVEDKGVTTERIRLVLKPGTGFQLAWNFLRA